MLMCRGENLNGLGSTLTWGPDSLFWRAEVRVMLTVLQPWLSEMVQRRRHFVSTKRQHRQKIVLIVQVGPTEQNHPH